RMWPTNKIFFFSSRRRHTIFSRDWSSDVCSSDLRTATPADEYRIANSYETAAFNFDREPRFYADLGFDGGIWYGQGRFDDDNGEIGRASCRERADATQERGT